MAINFNSALGVHEQALLVRERRAGVLAANLANADTPYYQARDLDFQALIRQAAGQQQGGARLEATRGRHIAAGAAGVDGDLLYRTPMQPSLDGNTVDTDIEMAQFARNSLDFQASLTFLQSKFRGLRAAIKGE
jgi:flagellar basal-body rod protein FlgB